VDGQSLAARVVSEVPPAAISLQGEPVLIGAFDVTPDGTELAVLYGSGKRLLSPGIPLFDELWLAFWDVATNKVTRRLHLSTNTQATDVFVQGYLDVRFTRDQRYLIVVGLDKVWVLDAREGSIIRLLNAERPETARPVGLRLLGGSVVAVTYQLEYNQFHTYLNDLPTGARIVDWVSSMAPDSVSLNGKFAVSPDPDASNKGGVTNVAVFNTATGEKTKSIPVGFAFKKGLFGFGEVTHGSVVARFLNDQQVVVIPDGNGDPAGHHAGDSLEIIDVGAGRVVREIDPARFGPTGIVVESADRSHFAVESVFARPFWFSLESTNPKHFKHELLVFAADGTTPAAIVAYPAPTERRDRSHAFNMPPGISADGSIVAIEADGEVRIFSVAVSKSH
jgi:hypothetical protein